MIIVFIVILYFWVGSTAELNLFKPKIYFGFQIEAFHVKSFNASTLIHIMLRKCTRYKRQHFGEEMWTFPSLYNFKPKLLNRVYVNVKSRVYFERNVVLLQDMKNVYILSITTCKPYKWYWAFLS